MESESIVENNNNNNSEIVIEKSISIPVHLRSVGEAPSLKKTKFKIDGSKAIIEVNKLFLLPSSFLLFF